MSKRPRSESRDRVTLDVGGQRFTTSVATLSGASAYFSRKFSQDWESASDEEIFLDRDADAFKVLLSCMRNRRVLLPEADKDLCSRVLLEANYFGVDWLLVAVKHKALLHSQEPKFDDSSVGGTVTWDQAYQAHKADVKRQKEEPQHGAEKFDERFGGLEDALEGGVLPERYFKKEAKKPISSVVRL